MAKLAFVLILIVGIAVVTVTVVASWRGYDGEDDPHISVDNLNNTIVGLTLFGATVATISALFSPIQNWQVRVAFELLHTLIVIALGSNTGRATSFRVQQYPDRVLCTQCGLAGGCLRVCITCRHQQGATPSHTCAKDKGPVCVCVCVYVCVCVCVRACVHVVAAGSGFVDGVRNLAVQNTNGTLQDVEG